MKPPNAIGSVPSLSGHATAYRWRSLPRVRRHRAGKPQGSSERVLPWQITMDQLIFASLSHTHYWYEVGMLKVPTVYRIIFNVNILMIIYDRAIEELCLEKNMNASRPSEHPPVRGGEYQNVLVGSLFSLRTSNLEQQGHLRKVLSLQPMFPPN